MLFVILPVLHLHAATLPPMNVQAKWNDLLSTLSGDAVAYLILRITAGSFPLFRFG